MAFHAPAHPHAAPHRPPLAPPTRTRTRTQHASPGSSRSAPSGEHRDASATRARSLAAELEWRRLSHRRSRVAQALVELRRLAEAHGGDVPTPLQLGIKDFADELARVERRLDELGTPVHAS